MRKNFVKLRTRARFALVLLSILLGIGVGAVALAAAILVAKLTGEQVGLVCYIIGGAAFALATTAFILIFLPSNKRLARQLDERYGLNEKVRTMVEFSSSKDPFAELQRQDADEHLGRVRFSPLRKGHLISLLVAVAVSASSLITAFMIPAQSASPNPEKPVAEFDKEKILSSITELINTVERSSVSAPLKSSSLTELRSLYNFVDEHDYMSEMKIEAARAVIAIDASLKDVNTALPIGASLSKCTSECLKELGDELTRLNGNGVKKKLTALKSELEDMERGEAAFIASELSHAISTSGASASSPLTESFTRLASAIAAYSNGSIASLTKAFAVMESSESDAVGTAAYNEVMIQGLNKLISQTVISRLCEIFGISAADLESEGGSPDIDTSPPAQTPGDEYVPDQKEENDQIGSGGIGTGDRVYGSNDVIYNPYTNQYVPYGEVLDEYNNKMLELVQDGKIPVDFKDFIQEYFRQLSSYTPEE